VRDLDDVINVLDIDASRPLFIAAHDWGGAIALGWAVDHPERVAGMILCNTGIAVPPGRSAPAIIRVAASAPLLDAVCRGTSAFVAGTIRLSGDRISSTDREAFRAPYRSAPSRSAIADFVGDIPLRPGHPSEQPLQQVANRLGELTAPVLLAWGAADPVFNDDFAADLTRRLPNTVLHRYPTASHLVMAEVDVAAVADQFIADVIAGRPVVPSPTSSAVSSSTASPRRLWTAIHDRRDDRSVAVVDMAAGEEIRFDELSDRVEAVASDLLRRGLQPGDRVAMLTPPGVDLMAAIYGVWRAGGVAVVADRGLGIRGLGAAVKGAQVRWVIGPRRALIAARSMRWARRATFVDVRELVSASRGELPPEPGHDDLAAILFTSGATGPAKGVVYRHHQLEAQGEALQRAYAIEPDDRLVAAFAPFALYGPALGITCCLPDCDVTAPGTLTANALDAACRRIEATMAFGSPTALANVVATGTPGRVWPGLAGLRTAMSAGAPVPAETLHAFARLAPNATLHTPYGMTEVLPVTDIDLTDIDRADLDDPAGGVCVGRPVDRAEVMIVELSDDTVPALEPLPLGSMGEIFVRSPWVSDGYVGLWATQRAARPAQRWHRSGDVGHIDRSGRLWVEGRSVHVIRSVDGTITPVPIERAVERGIGVARAAAVGVGPRGRELLVVVVEDPGSSAGLADQAMTGQVRQLVSPPVAGVLTVQHLPVDIRHNAKIDRTAVARWAEDVLAGRRTRPPK
jgi:acyl-CoA synthetase (AMP-forming)/AMP-acid ligase II/pimeloyl-ACP methyl ester carboxylesterase